MTVATLNQTPGLAWIGPEFRGIVGKNPDQSRRIWTNLDKPEHLAAQSSVHSSKSGHFGQNFSAKSPKSEI